MTENFVTSSVLTHCSLTSGERRSRLMTELPVKQMNGARTACGQSLIRVVFLIVLIPFTAVISGCGDPFWLPRAHKIEVQQGNILTADSIEAVQAGMSREEVAGLLGVPVILSAFHNDRWDYPFTRGPAGTDIAAKRFSVFFENDIVTETAENFSAESGEYTVPQFWFQSPRRVKATGQP